MSRKLISHNEDLTRLQNDGYDIEIVAGHLIMNSVPYVSPDKTVKFGRLVSVLDLSGDKTIQPQDHQVKFCGEQPCNHLGEPLSKTNITESLEILSDSLSVNYSFSSKPTGRQYKDFYEKMTTYEAMLSSYAQKLDPKVNPRTFQVLVNEENTSPFKYIDTSTSRAGLSAISGKLSLNSVSIIGLGGTGAYVFDQVAKTPVKEIRLFDGDLFDQHNAFRAPGAPSIEELQNHECKVSYFKRIYSKMHRNIVAKSIYLDKDNLGEIEDTDFAFICIDKGTSKRSILNRLEKKGIPFIDVGMGLYIEDNKIGGILRTTTSTTTMRSHVYDRRKIPFNDGDADNVYSQNIQIADLNMLSAAIAVVKWKKLFGFYFDLENEHNSNYLIDCNHITNEEKNDKTH